jgi:hypothetical protein
LQTNHQIRRPFSIIFWTNLPSLYLCFCRDIWDRTFRSWLLPHEPETDSIISCIVRRWRFACDTSPETRVPNLMFLSMAAFVMSFRLNVQLACVGVCSWNLAFTLTDFMRMQNQSDRCSHTCQTLRKWHRPVIRYSVIARLIGVNGGTIKYCYLPHEI